MKKDILNDLIKNDIILKNRIDALEKDLFILIKENIELKKIISKENDTVWVYLSDLTKELRKTGLIDDFRVIAQFDPKQRSIYGFVRPKDGQTGPGKL